MVRMSGSGPGYMQRIVITPYMHSMIFHVPVRMKKHGTLRQFSGQVTTCQTTVFLLLNYITSRFLLLKTICLFYFSGFKHISFVSKQEYIMYCHTLKSCKPVSKTYTHTFYSQKWK